MHVIPQITGFFFHWHCKLQWCFNVILTIKAWHGTTELHACAFFICLTPDTTWLFQYVCCLKPSSHVSSSIVSALCHCYFSVFRLLKPRSFSPSGALVQSGLYVCTLSTLRRAQQKHCWRDIFDAHMQRMRNSFFLKHEKKSSTKKWDIRAKGKKKSTNCVQNVMWI